MLILLLMMLVAAGVSVIGTAFIVNHS